MRNLVSGIIGVVLGSIWTLRAFTSSSSSNGSGAYAAGEQVAVVFGVIFLVAGIYYLRKGLQDRAR